VAFDLRFIPEPEVAALLEAAAVIVLPYRQIDASGALMSILPAGRPVIVTATGGLPEVIADGVHGHVVPPGDPTALAGAITRILEDPDAGRRMAEAVRTLARALPDWAAIAAVTVGAYFRAQQMWDAGRAPRVAMPRSGVSSPPTKGSGP
jgi:glycosyltransferase involved in cell wall biosynthesis